MVVTQFYDFCLDSVVANATLPPVQQQQYQNHLKRHDIPLILADKKWTTYGYKLKRSSIFLETIAAFEEHAESHTSPGGGGASSSSKPGMEEAAKAVASVSKRLGRRRDGQGKVQSGICFTIAEF